MNMRTARFGPVEIGLVTTLVLAGAAARGSADPGHPAPAATAAAPGNRGHELNYVYFYNDNDTTMSGDAKDIERARRFKHAKEPLLWFRDGSQDYLIRDAATLKQIEDIWRPVRELGDAEGKLGEQLGELGRQQGELGTKAGVIGTRQGTLAVRESALAMREQGDALGPSDKERLARQRDELRQQDRALRKELRAIDRPMRELGQKMEVLGREMEALGRRMEAASARAETELRNLFKRAIASGVARPQA